MRAKTNTGSQNAFKRKPYSTLAVSLGGNSEIKPTSNTLFDFYRINIATIAKVVHFIKYHSFLVFCFPMK